MAVTNFAPCVGLFTGYWAELPASRAPDGNRQQIGTGRSIVRDALAEAGWANDPEINNADHRNRDQLACRKCRQKQPVVARKETLFAALDALARDGVSEISLSGLAASLSEHLDMIVGRGAVRHRPRAGTGLIRSI